MKRPLVIGLALLLVSVTGPAWAAKPGWIAAPKTGCKIWNQNSATRVAVLWNGACQNGFAQGFGVLKWFQDGRLIGRYVGTYQEGKRAGSGVYTWGNINRYSGDWRDDKRDGHGVLIFPNGDRYDGDWGDDKRNGFGVYAWANGDRYYGAFRDDRLNGRGVYTWQSGNRYDGEWRDDKPNGDGVKTERDGKRIEGSWNNGCLRRGEHQAWLGVTKKQCGFM